MLGATQHLQRHQHRHEMQVRVQVRMPLRMQGAPTLAVGRASMLPLLHAELRQNWHFDGPLLKTPTGRTTPRSGPQAAVHQSTRGTPKRKRETRMR